MPNLPRFRTTNVNGFPKAGFFRGSSSMFQTASTSSTRSRPRAKKFLFSGPSFGKLIPIRVHEQDKRETIGDHIVASRNESDSQVTIGLNSGALSRITCAVRITIVMPAFNEEKLIADALRHGMFPVHTGAPGRGTSLSPCDHTVGGGGWRRANCI